MGRMLPKRPSGPGPSGSPSKKNNLIWKKWFEDKLAELEKVIKGSGKLGRTIGEVRRDRRKIETAQQYQTFYLYQTVGRVISKNPTTGPSKPGEYSEELKFGQLFYILEQLTGIKTIDVEVNGTSMKQIVGLPATTEGARESHALLFDGEKLTFPGAWYLWLTRQKRKPLSDTEKKGGQAYPSFLADQFLKSLQTKLAAGAAGAPLNPILEEWKLSEQTLREPISETRDVLFATVGSEEQNSFMITKNSAANNKIEIKTQKIDVWSVFEQAGCHVENAYNPKTPVTKEKWLYLRSLIEPTFILPDEEPFRSLLQKVHDQQVELKGKYGNDQSSLRDNKTLDEVILHLPCLPPAEYEKGGGGDPTQKTISRIKGATKDLLETFHEPVSESTPPSGSDVPTAAAAAAAAEQNKPWGWFGQKKG